MSLVCYQSWGSTLKHQVRVVPIKVTPCMDVPHKDELINENKLAQIYSPTPTFSPPHSRPGTKAGQPSLLRVVPPTLSRSSVLRSVPILARDSSMGHTISQASIVLTSSINPVSNSDHAVGCLLSKSSFMDILQNAGSTRT
jgi:hypothetical protein